MAFAVKATLRSSVVARRMALVAADIAQGFMSTSRLLVTVVGCITLIGGAVIFANDTARARFMEHAPAVVAHWMVPDTVDDAAGEPPVPDGEARPVASTLAVPEQRYIVQYLSRRYRVADEAVSRLVAEAYRAGEHNGVDPLLILAVMAIESSMNPFAESSVGAQGLMQVMTRVHTDKFQSHGGDHAALDPIANIHVGSMILKDLIRRGGSVERGLQLYVGAGNLPDDGGYAARVLGERSRIQLAATGKVDGALSAGLRADAARTDPRAAPAPATADAATLSPVSGVPEQPAAATDKSV